MPAIDQFPGTNRTEVSRCLPATGGVSDSGYAGLFKIAKAGPNGSVIRSLTATSSITTQMSGTSHGFRLFLMKARSWILGTTDSFQPAYISDTSTYLSHVNGDLTAATLMKEYAVGEWLCFDPGQNIQTGERPTFGVGRVINAVNGRLTLHSPLPTGEHGRFVDGARYDSTNYPDATIYAHTGVPLSSDALVMNSGTNTAAVSDNLLSTGQRPFLDPRPSAPIILPPRHALFAGVGTALSGANDYIDILASMTDF